MKIVQLISHYVPAWSFGGPLHVAHQLGRAFGAMGHEVSVCTTDLRDSAGRLDVPLDQPVDVDGVTVYYNPVSFLRRWGYSPKLGRRAEIECRTADLIINHFHYQYASFVGGRLARRFGKPYVVMAHGSLRRSGIRSRKGWLKNCYLQYFEEMNLRKATMVAYHSEEEMEDSLQWNNACWIPNGVSPDEYGEQSFQGRDGVGERPFKVVYMGRISHGKGLDYLLAAFQRLREVRDAELTLIGGDERGYMTGLHQQIDRLGLRQHVRFTGRLAGDEKHAALAAADIYALPSRSEGMSMAMLEAMYLGLPVLVTDRVGLWREVEAEDCGVVCRYDEKSIAETLLNIAGKSSVELSAMGSRGRALVGRKYTWPRIAKDLLERIDTSMGGGP